MDNRKTDPNPVAWQVEIVGKAWLTKVVRREDVAHEDAEKLKRDFGGVAKVSPLFVGDAMANKFFMDTMLGHSAKPEIENGQPSILAMRNALPFLAYAYSQGIAGAEEAGRNLEDAICREHSVKEANKPVVTYCGRRLSLLGTQECWGMLSWGVDDLPLGTKLYVAPPSQAVDLGRFREPVEHWRRDLASDYKGGHIKDCGEAMKEADALLALINSQAGR